MEKRTKQETIPMTGPGVGEPPRIKLIDEQAEKVSSLCKRRKKLASEEKDARAVLLGLLEQHKLQSYKLEDGRIVYIDDKKKALIRSPDEDEQF